MDVARGIHARSIRSERQAFEAGTLLAVRRWSKVLHGIQAGTVSQLLDPCHVAEELHDSPGGKGGLHDPYRESGPAREHLQVPFRKTVGDRVQSGARLARKIERADSTRVRLAIHRILLRTSFFFYLEFS